MYELMKAQKQKMEAALRLQNMSKVKPLRKPEDEDTTEPVFNPFVNDDPVFQEYFQHLEISNEKVKYTKSHTRRPKISKNKEDMLQKQFRCRYLFFDIGRARSNLKYNLYKTTSNYLSTLFTANPLDTSGEKKYLKFLGHLLPNDYRLLTDNEDYNNIYLSQTV